jgi:hypothetical protein
MRSGPGVESGASVRFRRGAAAALAPMRPLLHRGTPLEPGFLVIGTKRGGSTSVYHWIASHPQVAPCRTQKGTHFFDVNYLRGEKWYRSAFPSASGEWTTTGEGSPYYMFHPLALERIARHLPSVRLIAVLRDPVARAWSHYQYEVSHAREPLPFMAALDAERERVDGEEEKIVADPRYVSDEHRHHAYLQRGHYFEQLSDVYRYFPPDQLLVLQSEALFARPVEQLSRVWDFLGLRQVVLEDLTPMKQGRGRTIPAEAVSRLEEYYQPHNDKLYAMPAVDFRWDAA